MTFLIVLITSLLILDCCLLGLLILIQLPKKEAGVGVAFGGGATDALFGAGSGTALSNLTKYTATAFFIFVIMLSVVNAKARHASVSDLQKQIEKQNAMPITTPAMPTTPSAKAPGTNSSTAAKPVIPLTISTNNVLPEASPATNPPAK
jgi:protein translocase SecG subunit